MSVLLEVNGLSKSFGALKAVSDLSFQVGHGEAFGLLGPNGAGKSTTMMMICGLLQPDAGDVLLDGVRLDRRRPQSRERMGVVPQDLAIYPDLTARENLKFFGRLYHLDPIELHTRVDETLDQVGLLGRADDLAGTFSGGMKRRLNFAASVLHRPVLLILDEPTVGVDPQSRAHLIDCIRQLQATGTAIIYASHYMEEVQTICSRVAIVDHGRLLACDQIPVLLNQIPLEVEFRLGGVSLPQAFDPGPAALLERSGDELVLRLSSTESFSESAMSREVTRLLNLLAEHQVHVRSIRTHEPSLERLFLKLTGHTLRD